MNVCRQQKLILWNGIMSTVNLVSKYKLTSLEISPPYKQAASIFEDPPECPLVSIHSRIYLEANYSVCVQLYLTSDPSVTLSGCVRAYSRLP